MNYLFAGFFVIWALLFIYIFSLGRKQKELMSQLNILKDEMESRTKSS